jgi:peptide/nickel transport system substrate-binding protein
MLKQYLSIGLAILVLALLAACAAAPAQQAQPAAEEVQQEADEAAEAVQEEAAEAEAAMDEATESDGEETTLVVALADDIQTLDQCCANFIRANQAIYHVYDVPVIHKTMELDGGALVGDTSQIEGLVFESWERLENGTDIAVKIREGLKFHNGKEITADDVAYMLDRSLNTQGGMNWLVTNIMSLSESPTVTGKYELTIHTDRPNPLTIPALYMSGGAVMDSEEVKAQATDEDPWAEEWLAKNVAGGSGPFMIESWKPDEEVVFRANPDYHLGKADVDRLVWKVVPSPATRTTLLLNGAVDVVEGLTTDELLALQDQPGVKIITVPSKNMAYVGMNSGIEPLNDKRVRQAISYAIDYEDIIENVYNGEAQRLWGPLPTGSAYQDPSLWKYETDLDKARELLAEAGYADGLDVTLSISNAQAQHEQTAVRVQNQLREVGINVEIEKLSSSVFAEKKVEKELAMMVDESLAWIDDPNYVLSLTLQCGVFGNYMDYCNERVDEIIEGGWTELDEQKRFEMFQEAQEIIIDEAPWVFLTQPDFHLAVREDVEGYVHYLNEIVRYYDFNKTQ